MSTPFYPMSSFSKRALDSRLSNDLFANYAITCQCESLRFPLEFVDSLKSFRQRDDRYIKPIESYCCSRQYYSPYLKSYLTSNKGFLFQLSATQNDTKYIDSETVDLQQLAIESGFFNPSFYRSSNPDLQHCSNQELVDHFFENSSNEPNRDPSQYFSVSQYYALNPDVQSAQLNALEHYLLYGIKEHRPYAQSNRILGYLSSLDDHIDILDIRTKDHSSIFDKCNIAIYLHIHYPESLHEFLDYIAALPSSINLVITTTTIKSKEMIIELLRQSCLIERLDLCHVYYANRGRDIGAFIDIYEELIKYDIVCKLHAKKSPHLGGFGESWFRYLVQSTIGNLSAVENIANILFHSEEIGILAPTCFEGTNNCDWASNFDISQSISDQIFESKLDIDREMLRYPSATVFWFKPKALNHQQFRSIQPEFFPEEPIPIDGTSAHSLERLIPYISMLNEFQTIYYFDPSLYLRSAHEWDILECLQSFDERVTYIVIGHDDTNSGAPRTAWALQRSLINDLKLNCIVILINDGPLLQSYKDNGPTFVFKGLNESHMNAVFKYANRSLNVVTNTVISSVFGQLAQDYGHTHIALVHENADTGFWPPQMFANALNADLCVFPGEGVAQAAFELCNVDAQNNVAIRPQGIYRDNFPELSLEECYSSVRLELGIPTDSKIVLGCGKIEPRKGVDIFFETADLLLKHKNENIYFVWVGDLPADKCDDRDWAEQLLGQRINLPTSNCIVIGGCTKADRYFQACDVFYLTSRKDPFPGVVLEAMACKKPIIAFNGTTDVGNAFNDGIGGFLFAQFEVSKAAEQILSYITNPHTAHDAGVHNENVIKNEYVFSKYASYIIEKTKALQSARSEYKSIVSFIVPVFKTPLLYLQQLISSLENQSYPFWELCLAGGNLDKDVSAFLKYKMLASRRIKYVETSPSEQGISFNSNAAISISSGKYLALLDHDDLVSANCVQEIVLAHEENNCDFVYTAEDKVDCSGLHYFNPVYKYPFSEDKLLNSNYITHLSSFSRKLIDEIGGFRSEYDGAQDYDLILRAASRARKIFYLPRVLYHWRVFEGSTSDGNSCAKPYAIDAGRKAIESYLFEKGKLDFRVENSEIAFTYKVVYS